MKNIVLIGMSGVGKTAKGKYIARAMDRDFVDTDATIVKRELLSIDDIFHKYGEDYFRDIEEEIIKDISSLDNRVISTGGGIVLREKNIENLKKNGFIVYFKADVATITENLKNSKTIRPLLNKGEDLYIAVHNLYKAREDLYLNYSDLVVDVEDKSQEQIYNQVLKAYNEFIACSK